MYLVYFNITERYDLRDYKQYRNAVDMIRNAADEKISRNALQFSANLIDLNDFINRYSRI